MVLSTVQNFSGCPQGQGILEVREKSGKSILVREVREFGNFWEKSGKIGISASFLKNGQIFAVWPIKKHHTIFEDVSL